MDTTYWPIGTTPATLRSVQAILAHRFTHFGVMVSGIPMRTPSQCGMHLLQQSLPQCEPLSLSVRQEIINTTPQHRIEWLMPDTPTLPALYCYDGLAMYLGCAQHSEGGEPVWWGGRGRSPAAPPRPLQGSVHRALWVGGTWPAAGQMQRWVSLDLAARGKSRNLVLLRPSPYGKGVRLDRHRNRRLSRQERTLVSSLGRPDLQRLLQSFGRGTARPGPLPARCVRENNRFPAPAGNKADSRFDLSLRSGRDRSGRGVDARRRGRAGRSGGDPARRLVAAVDVTAGLVGGCMVRSPQYRVTKAIQSLPREQVVAVYGDAIYTIAPLPAARDNELGWLRLKRGFCGPIDTPRNWGQLRMRFAG